MTPGRSTPRHRVPRGLRPSSAGVQPKSAGQSPPGRETPTRRHLVLRLLEWLCGYLNDCPADVTGWRGRWGKKGGPFRGAPRRRVASGLTAIYGDPFAGAYLPRRRKPTCLAEKNRVSDRFRPVVVSSEVLVCPPSAPRAEADPAPTVKLLRISCSCHSDPVLSCLVGKLFRPAWPLPRRSRPAAEAAVPRRRVADREALADPGADGGAALRLRSRSPPSSG